MVFCLSCHSKYSHENFDAQSWIDSEQQVLEEWQRSKTWNLLDSLVGNAQSFDYDFEKLQKNAHLEIITSSDGNCRFYFGPSVFIGVSRYEDSVYRMSDDASSLVDWDGMHDQMEIIAQIKDSKGEDVYFVVHEHSIQGHCCSNLMLFSPKMELLSVMKGPDGITRKTISICSYNDDKYYAKNECVISEESNEVLEFIVDTQHGILYVPYYEGGLEYHRGKWLKFVYDGQILAYKGVVVNKDI